jgi:hypothetical protein
MTMQHLAIELTAVLQKLESAAEALRQARVEVLAIMDKNKVLQVSHVTDVSGQTQIGTD